MMGRVAPGAVMVNQAKIVPVDDRLRRIIRSIESSGNNHAMRFERKIFNRITNAPNPLIESAIVKANSCTYDTARVIYSMSWGAYQIMGFNLYSGNSIARNCSICDFLTDLTLQNDAFDAYCISRGINFSVEEMLNDPAKLKQFAVTYNGAESYADLIVSAAKRIP
jgi:hypothetical protein